MQYILYIDLVEISSRPYGIKAIASARRGVT
jgi:hypothetical protein